MPDMTPQQTAVADQLTAALDDLRTFIYSLDTPDLLAELRCMIGRMMIATAEEHALLSPPALTMLSLTTAFSRFDLAAGDAIAAMAEELADGDDPGWKPVPGAVRASEDCLCDRDPHGGIRGRIQRVYELGHQLHDDAGYDGPLGL